MINKNKKYKRKRRRTTKLHKWEKTTLKTFLKTPLLCSGEYWAFIGKTSGTGGSYGAIWGHTLKYDGGSMTWP